MLTSRWNVAALLFVVLLAAGCGSGQVKVYPVKGKITYGGKPMVGGGSIWLVPLGAQEGKTPGGHIAEDGTYVLRTHKEGDGSMAGEFRVCIYQEAVKEPRKTKDGEAVAKATLDVPPEDRIPDVYASHTESPLKTTIEPKSYDSLDIDIPRS